MELGKPLESKATLSLSQAQDDWALVSIPASVVAVETPATIWRFWGMATSASVSPRL